MARSGTAVSVRERPETFFTQPRSRIDAELSTFVEGQVELFGVHPDLVRVYEVLRDFLLAGGKRIRPLLCYWGWRGSADADVDDIFRAAASLELFHAFALIHDDIMDGTEQRRGRPAAHRALQQVSSTSNGGRRADTGVHLAILGGDLCFAWSDLLLDTCGFEPERIRSVRPLLHRMRMEVVVGQHLDLFGQGRACSVGSAMEIVRYKTAHYTIERPLQIGAVLANAAEHVVRGYTNFGIWLGEAFQLKDDLLGAFGDPAVTGKPNLDDFREGKSTVLVALTRQRASKADRRELEALYGKSDLDCDAACVIREVMDRSGARDEVEQMITERASRALSTLDHMAINADARDALQELTSVTIDRGA
ncbi:polyprenyl synthetase family protein [Lentzea sp. NPDC051208]|uniref:polyprenyl synthetase family protein n=1 Tax=Lentzea sp. NPDC051208 TaxID=3154642 RepID=UPI00343298BA